MSKPDIVYADLRMAIEREFRRLEHEWAWRRGDRIIMTLRVERPDESSGIEVARKL